MALTTFLPVYSGLDMAASGVSASETHRIPVSSPYRVCLARIPKLSASAPSAAENDFTTIDAVRALTTATIDGATATIVETQTPSVGNIGLQIISGGAARFSPYVVCNAADAGKTLIINYTGFMSCVEAAYLTEAHEAIARLETLPPCAVVSAGAYDGGRFGRGTADAASVVVLASRGDIVFSGGRGAFPTTAVNLAEGAYQVAAFSDVDGYKLLYFWLTWVTNTVALSKTESAESASPPTLAAPTVPADSILLAAIRVQGDGTGAAGGIQPVAASDIASYGVTMMAAPPQLAAQPFPVTFMTQGALSAGVLLDAPQVIPFAATLSFVTLIVETPGAAGDNTALIIEVREQGAANWLMLSKNTGRPTVAGGSAADSADTCLPVDCDFTVLSTQRNNFPAGTRLRAKTLTVATGAATAVCTIWLDKLSS